MMKLTHTAIVASGLRGFACAGLSTLITAMFSWSFVASTGTLNWMGSDALDAQEMAMMMDDHGRQSRGA